MKARDIVIVIYNYTGDRLNFGLAIEQAWAKYPDPNTMSTINADDVSFLPQTRAREVEESLVGPRGLWWEHPCMQSTRKLWDVWSER